MAQTLNLDLVWIVLQALKVICFVAQFFLIEKLKFVALISGLTLVHLLTLKLIHFCGSIKFDTVWNSLS